jgi:S1-C subfamily serine protease
VAGVIVDVLFIAIIVTYAIFGWRRGFLFAWFSLAGLLVGAVIAYFAVPAIGSLIDDEIWRAISALGGAIILVVSGQIVGSYVGDLLERHVKRRSTHIIDSIAGTAFNVLATIIALTVLASSVAGLGIRSVSQAIASSRVMMVIDAVEPDALQLFLARVQASIAAHDAAGFGGLVSGLLSPVTAPALPTDTAELNKAARSVVHISGTAAECSQALTGTGFVIAPGRVLTNAHVVAGVSEPVITAPNGQVVDATVVYFDPRSDIALLAAPSLTSVPLTLGLSATTGTEGAIIGYSFGGPQSARPADVLAVVTVMVKDIYGETSNDREVYTLRGEVRSGDSGAPLLDEDAVVRGMVFARTTDANRSDDLGYAMSSAQFDPITSKASSFIVPVHPGDCVRGG